MNYDNEEKIASIYEAALEKQAINIAGRLRQLESVGQKAVKTLGSKTEQVANTAREVASTVSSSVPKIPPINRLRIRTSP